MIRTGRRIFVVAGLCALVALLSGALPAFAADGPAIGKVTRLKDSATAMQNAVARPLKEGSDILVGDVISTGKGARLEFSLNDGSSVTLGGQTIFEVSEFTQTPAQESILMRMLTGAFKATSGEIAKVNPDAMTVATEVATIGIRGTTVWGGKLANDFEVALLSGTAVRVTTRAGSVDLTTVGQGTTIPSQDTAPTAPVTWAAAKVARARATVEF